MLPGKKYTPDDFLLIIKRRFWLLIIPPVVLGAISAVYARQMPNRFRSEAVIHVTPQRVPEAYVRASSTRVEERISAIRQTILSRTKLETLITELDLYPEMRAKSVMEDAVEQMRLDVLLQPRGDALWVIYTGTDPATVQKVADRLSDLVISESARDRESLTAGTDQFLEGTVDEYRRRLAEEEAKLAGYKQKYRGELPSQVEANLQQVQNFQMEIRQLAESINDLQDKRLLLEKTIQDLEGLAEQTSQLPAGAPGQPTTASQQLAAGQQTLQNMLRVYKPDHPDVKLLQTQLAELARRADAEALASPMSAEAPLPPAERERRRRLLAAHEELAQTNKQVEKALAEGEALRKASAAYQEKLAAAPTRETELIELTREYNQVASTYASFLAKREDSKISASLERRSLGSQFRLVDAARRPLKPFSPNRTVWNVGGLVVGFGLGLALVALLEYRDRTFRTDDDVTIVLGLPVLAVVPLMQSDSDQRRSRRRRWLMASALGVTTLGCLAIFAYAVLR